VDPAIDARGRGSARLFSRDDSFRVLVALKLQEGGVRVSLIKALMQALDSFKRLSELTAPKELRGGDLVELILRLSKPMEHSVIIVEAQSVKAILSQGETVFIVPERYLSRFHPLKVRVTHSEKGLLEEGVSIVVNLTSEAKFVRDHLFTGS
jgi:hypothetical protein